MARQWRPSLSSNTPRAASTSEIDGRWVEGDDGIPDELLPQFLDERYDTIDREVIESSWHNRSGLGGVPAWLQGPEAPPAPYRFAGQFWDDDVDPQVRTPSYGLGCAYLFVNPDADHPTALFLWQT